MEEKEMEMWSIPLREPPKEVVEEVTEK